MAPCCPVRRFLLQLLLAGTSQLGFGEKRPGIGASGGGSGTIIYMELSGHAEGVETESQPDYFYVPIPNEAPRKAEQEKLSGVVKNLHRKLRRKYREGENNSRLSC